MKTWIGKYSEFKKPWKLNSTASRSCGLIKSKLIDWHITAARKLPSRIMTRPSRISEIRSVFWVVGPLFLGLGSTLSSAFWLGFGAATGGGTADAAGAGGGA